MPVIRYYCAPGLSSYKLKEKREYLNSKLGVEIVKIESEYCYYVEIERHLSPEEDYKLGWLLCTRSEPHISNFTDSTSVILEIGPRLNYSTPFSTNAVTICKSINLPVTRLERSLRYSIKFKQDLTAEVKSQIAGLLHDRMTECVYENPVTSFDVDFKPEPWSEIDVITKGKSALQEASNHLGLAFDEWDINYYTDFFSNVLKRNPTTVECFDLAQSNSEHSRHWFFRGLLTIDGENAKETLFQMIFKTQNNSNQNNVIKFCDNSSAIEGFKTLIFSPIDTDHSSCFKTQSAKRHIIFTAETHNFPTGVAPFSGAATGTGGRIRDVHATGRGAHVVAGTAAYSFGNLNIPGYELPWEDKTFNYPSNLALPVDIAVEASNGASDYGNKFGEPIISGFARSFGMKFNNGERREWVKPIMFTGGIGSIEDTQIKKEQPVKGMLVVKIGGPVYRIGVGGGAASSVHVQGDHKEELDFGAVQRGDPEMEQKLNRVIRACIERNDKNIICSIHDQGAGGNGNVLKEIVEPEGAVIYTDRFQLGDPTISTMELWVAEYQESNAILINPEDRPTLQTIGDRENCPISFVGEVTGSKKIILVENENSKKPVDLELKHVLGSMPAKTFNLSRNQPVLTPLKLPTNITLMSVLDRVLRLPSVASKRYLTNKVDRSVTGLIAQQQCVGPLHTPLADVAVVALSYFDTVGSATSIGEQPIKGLVNAASGARMAVAEALTNLVFAKLTSLRDIKCSGNWMWAAKLPGEGAALYDACSAMCTVMSQLGIALDGGKDSLSMAARVGSDTVKAPGTLVVSAYAPCTDVRLTVTPDLKCPNGKGAILHVDLSNGKSRLGGTALAQCYNQLGDDTPDLDDVVKFANAFEITQQQIEKKKFKSGHDISDGGFIVCIFEMAFAGNCGLELNLEWNKPIETLFNEELGWIFEVSESDVDSVCEAYKKANIPCRLIGHSLANQNITIKLNSKVILNQPMTYLRDVWEETSFQLEMRQTNNSCVQQEKTGLATRSFPAYSISFDPSTLNLFSHFNNGPHVAVVREEGINGDREMIASLFMAGFEVYDVTMTDMLTNPKLLSGFKGIVFPGGFSYADVLGSARGWAARLLFHTSLKEQFSDFKRRPDTFSLGVCNGCQLMGVLGWVAPFPDEQGNESQGVALMHNISERFESRFVTVKINQSPSIMLKDMEESVLGVWVAHGEGRFEFKDRLYEEVNSKGLIPIVYVDDQGSPTLKYPLNPNGSTGGVAGVCSADGRHLAMMPHPERCVLPWQWAWMPEDWKDTVTVSPWLKMFTNAYDWCCSN